MYVSEVFRKNGKITFGFEDPIIYEKVKLKSFARIS